MMATLDLYERATMLQICPILFYFFSSLNICRSPVTGSRTPHGGPPSPCIHSGEAHTPHSRAGSGRQLGLGGAAGTSHFLRGAVA